MYSIREYCIFCKYKLENTYFEKDLITPVAHYAVDKDIIDNVFIPYNIYVCAKCNTPQLKYLGNLDEIYKINHADSTGKLMIDLHSTVTDLVIKYKDNINNIIEIGGGSGKLSDIILEKINLKYHIIDPSYIGDINKKFIYKSLYENIDDSVIDANTLIISHVFEHFYNPCDILEKISKNKSIQNFFLVFPDLEYYINNNIYHVLNTEHTFYCDNNFIIKLFENYGFNLVERYDYKNHSVIMYFIRNSKFLENKLINNNFSLEKYFNNQYKLVEYVNNIKLSNLDKSVYIWPASIHTITLQIIGLNKDIAMLDNSLLKINKKIYGYNTPIYSFKEIINKDDKNTIIILNGGVFNKDLDDIISSVKNIEFIISN